MSRKPTYRLPDPIFLFFSSFYTVYHILHTMIREMLTFISKLKFRCMTTFSFQVRIIYLLRVLNTRDSTQFLETITYTFYAEEDQVNN